MKFWLRIVILMWFPESCDISPKYGESRYGVSNISFVNTNFNISKNQKVFEVILQIDFRILFSSEQAGKPALPKLQLPDVGSWLPPGSPPGQGSPPPALLPSQPASPPPALLVPSQPSPPLPGKPACSPPQPSKPPTSRYWQRYKQ